MPVQFDKAKDRYSIPSTFFLPPTNFSASEALALVALSREVSRSGQIPFFEAARSAALKIENSLPPALQRELESAAKSITMRWEANGKPDDHRLLYQQLIDARAARQVVRIGYKSLTEWEVIETNLHAYHLLFSRHSWYVIGRSSIHHEIRTFKLHRIESFEPLEQKFKIPRSFRLEDYLGNAWGIIPGPGPDEEVHLHFSQFVAQNVAEINWHQNQRLEFREDGSLDFRASVSGLSEIVWWILGYADQVEVLAPKKLRKEVITRAKNMVGMYG